ncbi:hypothetical protein [Metabacillus bambusae]|uniref:Uncharacterized protein n=1 Tax=Metabacillus bambusae TaxID=2795218 RepID=A0ABS3NC00_9BACI|nr:hypothetical protein [Metabacillus bambusae]MBO1515690.1 hypothetical protein [Metabacillus bambusae]
MSQDKVEVDILLEHYHWAKDAPNKKEYFTNLVDGYIKAYFPHLEFITIKGMKAICKKK